MSTSTDTSRPGRRAVVLSAAAALASACAHQKVTAGPDVVVSRTGAVRTLAEAFDRAAVANGGPFHIHLAAGAYREKLTLAAPNVTITGDGPDSVILFDAAAGLRRPDGERWGTSGSATLTINAPGAVLRDLTI